VVGCHAALFLVARRHARFESNTVLWALHTIQPSCVYHGVAIATAAGSVS